MKPAARMLSAETQEYLSRCFQALDRLWGDRLLSMALFGSVARGKIRGAGDIDVLCVVENARPGDGDPETQAFRAVRPLEASPLASRMAAQGFPTRLSFKVYDREQLCAHPPLLLDLTEDAIVLHDPRGILTRELRALRTRMRRLGSRRVWTDQGAWYWILKPDLRFGEKLTL